ncbi:Murein DD-endopeptidase MepM and murein hydrolase activator NlpD, contain LysM domain [Marivirga sericea]|uniref:Murein DD-endopeptidase MepM and murein hydrolase activator NlpD, contain LysM domain n=1 Tax=Marivirga sericea TaxID=1028 RepID=A0A1X7I9D8_9BACT|nr:N-acetylmuramoyl-L-alanine amidase [Marivirga sericea]SMG10795.1 Murein DD-endopeptidase MepM and murein hydrolase activator NlpD, contain LysM domain [Marivirga sericea]
MNVLLIYFLKVITIQAILYLIYILIFHKSGRHSINRFYLIFTLVIGFIIPFMLIPKFQSYQSYQEVEKPIWHELANLTEFSVTEAELLPVERLNQSDFTTELIVLGISLISLLFLMKLIYSHFQLVRLKRQSKEINKNGYRIYCSPVESPFSYFKSIFIPKSLLNSVSFNTIMEHELVHVKKMHSIDRVLMEIILSIFWFHPLLYLFRNRLIETHEFQADAEVIALQQDPIGYQEILFQQINAHKAISYVNYFKLNTVKTRIKMINRTKNLSKWHYLLILPVLALMTFSFANKENAEFIAPLKSDVSDVFEYAINPSENYTPSIFPLQDAEGVKLTASFGNRIHPILKVERFHEGIDLKTYRGNPVLATADGIVIEAGINSEVAWGKIVRIKHGDMYETVYAHLSEVEVSIGDKIKRGDIIGKAGTTGRSTGSHLHYEVKDAADGFLDPLKYILDIDFKLSKNGDQSGELSLRKTDQKLRVILDPGHGGKDSGMKSSALNEKDIVLKVAQKVAENFKESEEIEIILTRDVDKVVSLEERVSNSESSDLFISLHIETHEYKDENSMLAIYNDQNDNASHSKYFSELLAQEMKNENKILKVGYSSGYYVLKNAKCPAVIFSMGYFSNPESEQYLNSEKGMKEIAQELSDAIMAAK